MEIILRAQGQFREQTNTKTDETQKMTKHKK